MDSRTCQGKRQVGWGGWEKKSLRIWEEMGKESERASKGYTTTTSTTMSAILIRAGISGGPSSEAKTVPIHAVAGPVDPLVNQVSNRHHVLIFLFYFIFLFFVFFFFKIVYWFTHEKTNNVVTATFWRVECHVFLKESLK